MIAPDVEVEHHYRVTRRDGTYVAGFTTRGQMDERVAAVFVAKGLVVLETTMPGLLPDMRVYVN